MKRTAKIFSLLIGLCGFLSSTNAAPGDLDLTFSGDGKLVQGIGVGGYDNIRATRILADGKILAAGFTSAGGRRLFAIARYNADGSLDASFGEGGRKMFSVNAESSCEAMALQPDGKIVMVGWSEKGSTNYDFAVARLNPDGSFDTTFDGDGMLTTHIDRDDLADAVAIQADGKIVVAGYSGGNPVDFALVRYNSDGSLDTTFDGDGKLTTAVGSFGDYVNDLAIQTDGKIIAAGNANDSTDAMALVRYNANGSLDTSFDGDGKALITVVSDSSAYAVALQPDGKIVAAGKTSSASPTNYYFAVIRLNTDGSLDSSFDGDGRVTAPASHIVDSVSDLVIQTDGKIAMSGHQYNGANSDLVVLRYDSNGSPDTTFDGDGKVVTDYFNSWNEAYGIAVQTDGKIVAVGGTDTDPSVLNDYDFVIVRYNTNGSLDPSFAGDGSVILSVGSNGSYAHAVAMQPDGKIVVAGQGAFTHRRGGFALTRYLPNGTLDLTFDGDGVALTEFRDFSAANAVAIQPDGKIVAAGQAAFGTSASGDFALIRYNADGSIDTTFGLGGRAGMDILGFNDYITDIIIQPDGKILVGGTTHTDPSGIPYKDFALARFNPDGSLDTSFRGGGIFTINIGLVEQGEEILLQPDGKIVIVGSWQNNNQNSQFALVRFHANGETDGLFGNGGIVVTSVVNSRDVGEAAALQPDGKIVVAGTNWGGSTYDIILARYNPNGSLDTTFDGDGKVVTDVMGSYESAASVAIQTNGKIVVAGKGSPGDEFSNDALLVRYNADGSLDSSYGTGGFRSIDFVGGTNDWGYGLALDSIGRAVIVGEANGSFAIARVLGDSAAPRDAPFDFDGDGKTDLSIFRPNGEWWYQRSSDGGNNAFGFGNSSDELVPGDFTGDGKTDIAIWRPATGEWFILRSENVSYYSYPFGTTGDVPVVGDFDADEKSDTAIYRPSNSTWYIRRSSDGGTTIQQFGQAGDVPVVGDYDGDGKTDIAIYRVSLGEWWLNRSTAGTIAYGFGNSSDKPVQGDYTGDGKTDVAIWRGSTGEWFVLRSENISYYSFPFGVSTDLPAPGDYDGDGKFDAGVFRPSNSTWYVQRTTAGTLIQTFGQTGDRPVPNVFVP